MLEKVFFPDLFDDFSNFIDKKFDRELFAVSIIATVSDAALFGHKQPFRHFLNCRENLFQPRTFALLFSNCFQKLRNNSEKALRSDIASFCVKFTVLRTSSPFLFLSFRALV